VTGDYGRLALAKMAAFALLGWFGWWHRRRTLPGVAAGSASAFTRLAAVEALVMAAAMGLAVALGRTAPSDAAAENAFEALLGEAPLPEMTAARLAGLWKFDLPFTVLVGVLALLYAAGIARRRRHPVSRTVCWYAGLLIIVVATQSGIGRYAFEATSAQLLQFVLLSGLAAALLVAGAPIRLAMDALRPARIPGDRGPREWLLLWRTTRMARTTGHPLVASALLIGGSLAFFLPPWSDGIRTGELRHTAMNLVALVLGLLFVTALARFTRLARRSSRQESAEVGRAVAHLAEDLGLQSGDPVR
jgi:hypothetical protein